MTITKTGSLTEGALTDSPAAVTIMKASLVDMIRKEAPDSFHESMVEWRLEGGRKFNGGAQITATWHDHSSLKDAVLRLETMNAEQGQS